VETGLIYHFVVTVVAIVVAFAICAIVAAYLTYYQ
jgi:hypothetical protein